jgi:hypothetical protein
MPGRGERRGDRVDGGGPVSPPGLLVELIYGLVGCVKNDTPTTPDRRAAVFYLLCWFWLTGAQGRRIRSGGVKLEAGFVLRLINEVFRRIAVPALVSALEM